MAYPGQVQGLGNVRGVTSGGYGYPQNMGLTDPIQRRIDEIYGGTGIPVNQNWVEDIYTNLGMNKNLPSSTRDRVREGIITGAESRATFNDAIKAQIDAYTEGTDSYRARVLQEQSALDQFKRLGEEKRRLDAGALRDQWIGQIEGMRGLMPLLEQQKNSDFGRQSKLMGLDYSYRGKEIAQNYQNSLGLLGAQTNSQSRLQKERYGLEGGLIDKQAGHASALNNQDWGHRKDYLDIEKYWDDIQGQRGLAANIINASRNSRFL